MGGNQVKRLENLPDSLQSVDMSGNQIQRLENLPGSLHTLEIISNRIQQLKNLPDSLYHLDISDNQIQRLENLPDKLHSLDIYSNRIQQIENLPDSLNSLNIHSNQIKNLQPIIPFFKKGIYCGISRNPIENPPIEIVSQGNEAILRYFEKIEKKPPIVFISYSWDNEKHKKWVQTLAEDLINNRIDVILDIYEVRLGSNLTHFMEKSVEKADKVLLILTENYKLKADKRSGGVGYEYSMINENMYGNQLSNDKFIPILRSGNKDSSIPNFIKSFIWLDMSSDEKYEDNLETLTREIFGKPKIVKPSLGEIPDYIKGKLVEKKIDVISNKKKPLALQLIEKEKVEKTGHLDLGNCGLTPYNPQLQEVWNELGELMHLETLILSNEWYNKEKRDLLNSQKNRGRNLLNKIPRVIATLINLKELTVAGEHADLRWGITKLENLPQSISILNISSNYITELENLPPNLNSLNIHSNKISKLENFPETLNELYIGVNQIEKIENLPKNIHTLSVNSNKITRLEGLPKNLIKLDISSNQISKIENIDHLSYPKRIDFANNKIQDLTPIKHWIESGASVSLDWYVGIIHVKGCPLTKPPLSVVQKGYPAVFNYFKELKEYNKVSNDITPTMKKIFISYSHEDMKYKKKLETAFAVQKRLGKVELWNDQEILAGAEWNDEIFEHLESADIIVLLFSPDFFASNFIWDKELPVIMRRFNDTSAKVIPILLRPCDWTATEYAKIQAVPTDEKTGKLTPINQWQDQDAAFQKVVEGIKQLL